MNIYMLQNVMKSKVSSLIDQENNLSKISDLVAAYMQLSDEKSKLY